MKERPVKVIVHFNRYNAKKELPWTVHIRGQCLPAREVLWDGVTPRTVWKPEKSTNPRGWIECKGTVSIEADNTIRISKGE